MGKKDSRVDAYIERAQPFARPILKHLRKIVHRGAADVDETIKWGFPHFESGGAPMAHMAAFKQHSAFGFWKASLLMKAESDPSRSAMGSFGRIRSLADLPSDAVLLGYVKKAAALNAAGIKVARARPKRGRAVLVPDDFERALAKNKRALATFDAMSPSHRREYVDWIVQAKAAETRKKRLETAVQWLAEGKNRNWKYERK